MKRRHFLKSAGSTLALASLGLHATLAFATTGFRWSRAGAAGLVGQSFWLNHPLRGAMAIVLADLREPALTQLDPRLEQFSLMFRAPAADQVADGTYELEHATLGQFALHLIPAGRDGDDALYRSDFTLLV